MKNFTNREKIIQLSTYAQILCLMATFAFALLALRAALDYGIIVYYSLNHIPGQAELQMDFIKAKNAGQLIEKSPFPSISPGLALYMLANPAPISNLPLAILEFAVALSLYRLFKRLRSGYFFDDKSVAHLHTAGKWCVGYGIGSSVVNVILTLTTPATAGPSFGALLVGTAFFLVAWLLHEAQNLQEEHKLTV